MEPVGAPVPTVGGEPANNSLIAEIAFGLVAADCALLVPIEASVEARVREYLNRFRSHPPGDVDLDDDEQQECVALAKSLRSLLDGLGPVEFYPLVPGCGVVDAARADVTFGSALGEVKSVSRPFRASDLKQLLTYCAMAHAAGGGYDEVVLLNPRRGTRVAVSTEFLCRATSGLTSTELFDEIQRAMVGLQTSG
ncbi:hypothetical protein [Actinotalea subterranea]|uniref:hypothetical protein n=1 Tax=Actinotalea subterranea TaxID=2607497 RepID=UPI0011F04C9D|nr:hypothetical protein [Actinotalea subterranea]